MSETELESGHQDRQHSQHQMQQSITADFQPVTTLWMHVTSRSTCVQTVGAKGQTTKQEIECWPGESESET